jgi:hypothetical protein
VRVLAYTGGDTSTVTAAALLASEHQATLTVIAVAVIEPERRGCCDMRSGVWNRLQREDARRHREMARAALEDVGATFEVHEGPDVATALSAAIEAPEREILVLPKTRKPRPGRHKLAQRIARRTATSVRVVGE